MEENESGKRSRKKRREGDRRERTAKKAHEGRIITEYHEEEFREEERKGRRSGKVLENRQQTEKGKRKGRIRKHMREG